MKQDYDGSCHCGAVRFRTHLDTDDAFACDCSVCTKKGSVVVRVDEANFDLLTPLEDLTEYTFNKHVAKHYFCPRCGIHTFNRPRSYPELWAINLRCLNGVDINTLDVRPVFGSKLD